MKSIDIRVMKLKSLQYRRTVLRIIQQAQAGHTGGSLSCIDLLNVLYSGVLNITPENFHSLERDRFIMSKGHSVEALYTVLADRGFFPLQELDTLCRNGSIFIGHPTRKVPGIEQNTGALGHGLAVGVGLAIAAKMDRRAGGVFVLMGDGELAEGSVWEAAMAAAHYKLDNLTAIIDRNGLQISGSTEVITGLEPLEKKFKAFGFATHRVDGHNLGKMVDLFGRLPFQQGKPSLVLAETVKGKGISFIENEPGWHHHVPNPLEYERAIAELDAALESLEVMQ